MEIDYQKRNKIYKLTNLLGIMENLERMRAEITKQGKIVLSKEISMDTTGVYSNPIFKKILERYDEYNEKAKESIDYSEMVDIVAKVYYDKFTEDEIDQLLSFLSSDLGKKWVKTSHEMAPELAEISVRWNQKILEYTSKIIEQLEEEGLFDEGFDT